MVRRWFGALAAMLLVLGLFWYEGGTPPAMAHAAMDEPAVAYSTAEQLPSQDVGRPHVLAIQTFLADMAQNVAGSRLRVDALVPLGVDPHEFEPTPADVATVAKSDVVIANGAGFEEYLDRLLRNAGGSRPTIEASAGLSSRQAREGEVAEMSEADLSDAICQARSNGESQTVFAGASPDFAPPLPSESGLFQIQLSQTADGSYGGYLYYSTDEGGDFQVASGNGSVAVADGQGTTVDTERSLSLGCGSLTSGAVIEMEKDGQYTLSLSGFSSDRTLLLVGPLGGHHHHQGDPHFWLDPINAIKYVENIRDGLSQVDPDGAATYAANATAYIAQLRSLDASISAQVAQVPRERRLLVTNHESFGYFADRYDFKVVGTIVPSVSTDASPSAQQLARLIDRVRATGARAIFLETGTNPRLAEQLASETGIRVVTQLYTHSITDANGPAPTYIDMMRYNTNAIVDALR